MDEEEKKEEESKDGATENAVSVDGVPNPYGDQPETTATSNRKSGFIDIVKKAKEKVETMKNKEAAAVEDTPSSDAQIESKPVVDNSEI